MFCYTNPLRELFPGGNSKVEYNDSNATQLEPQYYNQAMPTGAPIAIFEDDPVMAFNTVTPALITPIMAELPSLISNKTSRLIKNETKIFKVSQT